MHDWQERVKAHDSAMAKGRASALSASEQNPRRSELRSGRRAAVRSEPGAHTRAERLACRYQAERCEGLIDSGANALKLVETIRRIRLAKSRGRKWRTI
jgi:hypothetical protein